MENQNVVSIRVEGLESFLLNEVGCIIETR